MIESPHLATKLLYDVSRRCSLYLNSCVTSFSSEDMGAPGSTMPLLVDPILIDLDSGRYVVPLFFSRWLIWSVGDSAASAAEMKAVVAVEAPVEVENWR